LIHLEQGLTQDSQSSNLRVLIRRGKRCCELGCLWGYFWGYFWGCLWGYACSDIIKTALGRAAMER